MHTGRRPRGSRAGHADDRWGQVRICTLARLSSPSWTEVEDNFAIAIAPVILEVGHRHLD